MAQSESRNAAAPARDDPLRSESRRDFLKTVGLAGAAISMARASIARAEGELGFWAKDLSNEKLVGMLNTICRIRWHERT
ncbi:MAG TPA: twin-arginine translocation signal domain-containing protein, partial [Usitatibacter sp.]|nr:twin-arginine translocation signal domain-containing protein [Usitatibacter sp.]